MRKTALALMVTIAIAVAGCGETATSGSTSEESESADSSKAPAKLTLTKRDQAFCVKATELPALEDDTDGHWNLLFLMMSDYAENADLQAAAEELRSKTPDGAERRPYLDRVLMTCTENGMSAATAEESEPSGDDPGEAASIDPATWPPKVRDQIPGIWVPDATITLPDDKWHFALAGPKKRSPLAYYDKLEKDQSAPMKIQVRNLAAGGPGGKATAEQLDKELRFGLPAMKEVYDNVRRHDNVTSDGGLLLAHLSYESEHFWTEHYETLLYGDTLDVDLMCAKDKRFPENSAEACAAYGEKVAKGIHPN